MAKTQTKSKTQQNDLLSQMRELSSEALHRLTDVPGGSRLVEMANETKARLDDMQKRLLGLEYNARLRVVEPHDFGAMNGTSRVFVYQLLVGATTKLPQLRMLLEDPVKAAVPVGAAEGGFDCARWNSLRPVRR